MKTFRIFSPFVLLAAAAVLGAAEKPHGVKPVNPPAQTSQSLADLQKAKSQNVADIARLKARMKHDAEARAAASKQKAPKDKTDSLSELGQQDQMQLQLLMERKAKLEEMISNVLKKSSDTSAGVVQNLK